ncbi:hypothetical protein SAC_42 [Staphylococcus phage SAC]|nr:hypothetical protein SAC_42 [Staphylococcus phage SAC]
MPLTTSIDITALLIVSTADSKSPGIANTSSSNSIISPSYILVPFLSLSPVYCSNFISLEKIKLPSHNIISSSFFHALNLDIILLPPLFRPLYLQF